MTNILRSFFFDKEQFARLKKLSSKTRIPQSVYIKEALDLVLNKYERKVRAGFKRERSYPAGKLKGLNRETLIKLYVREGKSLRTIAKMFDCSYFNIGYRCKKYGIKLRPTRKKIIKLNKSVLKRLCVKEDKSSKEVAEMFSCSSQTVLKKCKEYGISLKKGRRIKGLTRALLYKLYIREGKTTREIGKIVGCSFDVVMKRCRQFGIPLRNPGSKKIEIDESALRRLYIKERRSMSEIAKIFGCGVSTISKRVKRFELKR